MQPLPVALLHALSLLLDVLLLRGQYGVLRWSLRGAVLLLPLVRQVQALTALMLFQHAAPLHALSLPADELPLRGQRCVRYVVP
jgi:hypothetical protein